MDIAYSKWSGTKQSDNSEFRTLSSSVIINSSFYRVLIIQTLLEHPMAVHYLLRIVWNTLLMALIQEEGTRMGC